MVRLIDARSRRHVVLSTALLLSLLPASTAAQAVDRIDLPAGWQPEGITTDGTSLFVGSLADGAIWKADPATGEGAILAPGAGGMVAVGVEYEAAHDRLWTAGGATGAVSAYDAATGELLATFPFEAGFVNDLAATDTAIFATDSMMPQLLVIPLAEDGALPAADATSVLPYSGDYEHQEGFNVNGIVAAPEGLIVVQSSTGSLFLVDSATGSTTRIDTGEVDLTNGDGLELAGSTLYVSRNQDSEIAKLELGEGAGSAALVDTLTSPDLDVSSTVALLGSDLWVVNARFGTEPGPDTPYWVTRLDA
jgi:sugar lactone lactonase YvrE